MRYFLNKVLGIKIKFTKTHKILYLVSCIYLAYYFFKNLIIIYHSSVIIRRFNIYYSKLKYFYIN